MPTQNDEEQIIKRTTVTEEVIRTPPTHLPDLDLDDDDEPRPSRRRR